MSQYFKAERNGELFKKFGGESKNIDSIENVKRGQKLFLKSLKNIGKGRHFFLDLPYEGVKKFSFIIRGGQNNFV